jgi:hypothetical protein
MCGKKVSFIAHCIEIIKRQNVKNCGMPSVTE